MNAFLLQPQGMDRLLETKNSFCCPVLKWEGLCFAFLCLKYTRAKSLCTVKLCLGAHLQGNTMLLGLLERQSAVSSQTFFVFSVFIFQKYATCFVLPRQVMQEIFKNTPKYWFSYIRAYNFKTVKHAFYLGTKPLQKNVQDTLKKLFQQSKLFRRVLFAPSRYGIRRPSAKIIQFQFAVNMG